jgi:SAM-dependent methyltransferase
VNSLPNQEPSEITSPEYWDSFWSPVEYGAISTDDPQNGPRGYFLKAMDRHAGPLAGKTVLELGGGMSQRLVALAKYRQMQATAVDYAPETVKKSRKFFAMNGCNVELLCENFFSPALDNRKFNLVTHWGVLEHQIDPMPLLQRSVGLCSPDGKIVFTMPQMRGPGAWLWKHFSPSTWEKHIYHSDEAVKDCFARLRWSCKPVFWGAPLIHMMPSDIQGLAGHLLEKCQNFSSYYLAKAGMPYQYGLPFISENRGFIAWKNL